MKLALGCKTRSNFTYLMLDVTIYYKDAFKHQKQWEPLYECLILNEEQEITAQFCDKLKTFYDITERFPRTKYPTINSLSSKIHQIKMELMQWLNHGHPFIQDMA